MPDDGVGGESDMRRRAAWMLAMLVVAAILVVVVMTTLLNSDKGGGSGSGLGPDPITSTAPAPSSGSPSSRPSSAGTSAASPSTSPSATGSDTCPTQAPCALATDVGNAVAAINAYREQNHMSAVPGSVTAAAQTCALNRGNGCSGGWAETEIPAPPNGALAVQKITQFAKLLDPQMTAIQIGWAYNPGTKTYYFVTIRTDS